MMKIIESFVARKPSYDRFAKLQDYITQSQESECSISLDIKNRLGYTFLFLFATLPYLAEKYNKKVNIFCNNKTLKLFKKLGYLDKNLDSYLNYDVSHMLKANAGLITTEEDIFKIVTEISSEAPVKMSSELSAIFISKAGEMYNNAIEHSQGKVLGAKYFKNQKNTYCFACYDTGVGIPTKVMSAKKGICDQVQAFRWAMINGHSTVKSDIPRGLGLGLLQDFAQANDGTIRICSDNILYTYNSTNGETYHILNNKFYGTLFEMDIIADNNKNYILK